VCGICGIHAPAGVTGRDRLSVDGMAEVLAHRGPDDEGRWSDAHAALGHRRLAVIDLPGGRQPLVSEDGRVALVYNGEVYNFADLRGRLAARGHRFRTAGDTEVVLRGYEEWGDAVVERLRGMFAFAVWDARRSRLLLARDRLGVKPLYHAELPDGRLLFASEIKALLQDEGMPRALNARRLPEYLAFRTVSGRETLFEGIHELPPGTIAVREGGRLALTRYWSPERPAAPRQGDPVARGRTLMADAVRSRLVSDVPLGTLNSGGLDSSLVTAIAAGATDGPLDTFCVGFADPEFDERPHARGVAEAVGSRHHELELTPERLEAEIDRLTWANDEPLFASNSIGMHLVFREAKERAGVTVLLSGEGADEVFGGYRWYHLAMRRAALARYPGLRAAALHAPRAGRAGRLRRLFGRDVLAGANAFTDPAEAWALAGGNGDDPLAARSALVPRGGSIDDDLFAYDQRTYLQGILQRQDRMGMAAGVEAREPMLDHHLVEWANALPVRTRLAGGITKSLLRDIAAPWLSPEVLHRAKNGFAVPTGAWMMPGRPLCDRVRALTDAGAPMGEALDRGRVARLVEEHTAGRADHRVALWSLMALDAWARVFLGARMGAETLPGAARGRAGGPPVSPP
jgi:asparagine synthase (glutamine-hydrolysing)